MKRTAIAASLTVLAFAIAIQAQTPAQKETGSVEQELIKLENEWADVWVKSDVAFFDRIEADDYTYTACEGSV